MPEEQSRGIGVAWWWWVIRKLKEATGWLDSEMRVLEGPYNGTNGSGERAEKLLNRRGESRF